MRNLLLRNQTTHSPPVNVIQQATINKVMILAQNIAPQFSIIQKNKKAKLKRQKSIWEIPKNTINQSLQRSFLSQPFMKQRKKIRTSTKVANDPITALSSSI